MFSERVDICAIDEAFFLKHWQIRTRSDTKAHVCFYGPFQTTDEMLKYNKISIADYILSRNDFLLSDLIPKAYLLNDNIYKEYRERAISHVNELIERMGPLYARTIAADIGEIPRVYLPEPTEEDIEALKSITKKISSKDWMNDTQVTSGDFLSCEIPR